VPEPVSGGAELDRQERVARRRPVEPVAAVEYVPDDVGPGDLRQVLVDQEPLVVPQRDLAGNEVPDVEVLRSASRAAGNGRRLKFASSVSTRL